MMALHDRGVACSYLTIRSIINGVQDERLDRATKSRFAPKAINNRVARLPAIESDAMRNLRTMYPSTVVTDASDQMVLKSGVNQAKIGGVVLKGKWRGMPIYALTLEERATCPVSCRHLRSCYGNSMQFARRFAHNSVFERRLVEDVVALAHKHPDGFAVRLHVLGDFYSVDYVKLWRAMIETIPALRVWGYSARYDDEIGDELRSLVADHWDRFAVRFSNAPGSGSTISIELPVQKPLHAFICPVQTNKTESCATCAACWSTRKPVCFLQH